MGISTSNASIRLQILLRTEWRTPQGVERVRSLLAALGITPTAAGAATLSAELDDSRFKDIFGTRAKTTPPSLPAEREFGRSGGHVSEDDLEVPAALSEYVESISAAPSHIYLEK
jgi:hypothetical protein